jgi:hypothetical protein
MAWLFDDAATHTQPLISFLVLNGATVSPGLPTQYLK